MFETAELNRSISKSEFKSAAPLLRQQLLELQDTLHKAGHFQTILVFAGVDGAGKGETVSLLNDWMDPRWLITRAYDEADHSAEDRPEFWEFWRDLPPRGRIGMFLSAWYSQPVLDRVYGKNDEVTFHSRLERIAQFERALARDGALILKFWMHLSRDGQEQRLKSLERDPLTKARVTKRDWKHWKLYDEFIGAAEQVISRTNRGIAPWTIVEGVDANYRSMTVATILRDALKHRLDDYLKIGKQAGSSKTEKQTTPADIPEKVLEKETARSTPDTTPIPANTITILNRLDMAQSLEKADYKAELVDLQARLHRLHLQAKAKKIASMLVFEGPDAAGKGGAIRRIGEALEARNYQVHGFAAPTDEENAQNYLWRFWRRLPRAGYIGIFDRSWYGRVLVERVEGFASEDEWRRSYAEINDFEDQLIDHGIVLIKYWIHITKDEQFQRFKLREKTPYKRWKLTDEDWRNREKWEDYEQAVNDMVQYTSTAKSPWTLIEGNDKRFARVKAIRTYCDRLTAALG
ncbi:MAG: polyphosphate:AMP phosphotransferase [Stappiaceae bacterium]